MSYKKIDYIDAIELHLRREGKKLSNLRKATIPILKKLIEDYAVDMSLFMEMKRQQHDEKQAEEEAYQAELVEQKRVYDNVKESIDILYIKNKWVMLEQLKDITDYKQNKKKYDLDNKQMSDFGLMMARRLNGFYGGECINANGIKIQIDSMERHRKANP